jgi:hypothetical protein
VKVLTVITHADEHARAEEAAAFTALDGARNDRKTRYALVRLTAEGDGQAWAARYQHDVAGALRGMRFLADKVRATYDPTDAKAKKVLDAIDRHLATLDALKADVLDPLLAPVLDDGAP